MKKENTKIVVIELLLVLILIICTLLHITNSKLIIAIFTTILCIGVSLLLKRERTIHVGQKKITNIMLIFAILYVSLFYMIGLYTGYDKAKELLSLKTIINSIIPLIVIIITTENIRNKLLINKSKLSKLLIVTIITIIEIAIYTTEYKVYNLNSLINLMGFVSFAAIANNLMYNYIGENYGKKPIIIYRLIITLYPFIIPISSNIYIYYRTFLRVIYPLIIFLYIEKYYSEDYLQVRKKDQKKEIIYLGLTVIVLTIFIQLISNNSYYGVLVIGSNSMQPSITKGDVIFFKKSKNVESNDIIVFTKDKYKIVHRVVDVKNINNEQRYYTKGDAIKQKDKEYVTNNNLVGKVMFKIKYIGNPTLWLKSMFK